MEARGAPPPFASSSLAEGEAWERDVPRVQALEIRGSTGRRVCGRRASCLSSLGHWHHWLCCCCCCCWRTSAGYSQAAGFRRGHLAFLAMLATLMTALFFMVKALGQLGNSLSQEEPLPYLVHPPLPWQVQCVTQSRRTSRDSGKGGSSRHNSIYGITGRKGEASPCPSPVPSSGPEELSEPTEVAAVAIQRHGCKHQQKHEK